MSRATDGGSPALLWHTLRHLRARQLWGQAWKRLAAPLHDPSRVAISDAPPYPGCRLALCETPPAPGRQDNDVARLRDGRFEFLNTSHELGWPPDWQCAELPLLWRYNLHYFEWLWALDYDDARAIALDWIERHPAGRHNVGWAPYPVSLRLQNWLVLFFGRWRERTENDSELRDPLWRSVWAQTHWLSRNLEYHLMANHLLENAFTLALAGACFDGDAAAGWRRRGNALLTAQLDEQILPDGMHYERSPMYHLRALYGVLLLALVEEPQLARIVRPLLPRMATAARRLLHPDGGIALLNDSAFGIVNEAAPLLELAERIGGDTGQTDDGPWALDSAGYYGIRDERLYLVCDAGPIGPDYMTGHGHGDLLSLELSVGGRRMLVDGGIYSYEADAMRRYSRSTRAHNTVEIDGVDQCEFWGTFRTARRARPFDVSWTQRAGGFELEAAHDGYHRLAGRPVHRRRFAYRRGGPLQIVDRVDSERSVDAVARLHLHPECRLTRLEADAATIEREGRRLTLAFSGSRGELSREQAWYLPEFGVKRDTVCLARTLRGRGIECRLRIEIG